MKRRWHHLSLVSLLAMSQMAAVMLWLNVKETPVAPRLEDRGLLVVQRGFPFAYAIENTPPLDRLTSDDFSAPMLVLNVLVTIVLILIVTAITEVIVRRKVVISRPSLVAMTIAAGVLVALNAFERPYPIVKLDAGYCTVVMVSGWPSRCYVRLERDASLEAELTLQPRVLSAAELEPGYYDQAVESLYKFRRNRAINLLAAFAILAATAVASESAWRILERWTRPPPVAIPPLDGFPPRANA
jgi:hypothetical protein